LDLVIPSGFRDKKSPLPRADSPPTILDGGVTRFTTGEVAEHVIAGFLRAAKTDKALREASPSPGQPVAATYLAGAMNAAGIRDGIEKAIIASRKLEHE
jgi:hypothetical protein